MINLDETLGGVDAVCFDAFGTLFEITGKRRPYARLFRALPKDARKDLKYRLMREPLDLSAWCSQVNAKVSDAMLAEVFADIESEVDSIRLYKWVAELWQSLRQRGLKIGICSNLAAPYGAKLLKAMPDQPDAVVFSYEVGLQKPEPEIYQHVSQKIALPAGRILFVGDSARNDVNGPKAVGMKAVLVEK
jgi:HAD superfamily hydrolase (TIGR01549 family)